MSHGKGGSYTIDKAGARVRTDQLLPEGSAPAAADAPEQPSGFFTPTDPVADTDQATDLDFTHENTRSWP